MADQRWLLLFLLVLLAGAMFQSPPLAMLAGACLALLGIARWWQKHSLDSVIYRRKFHFRRGFPGESYPVRIEVENRKLLPLTWLRVEDPWPKGVAPEENHLLAPSHIEDQTLLTSQLSLRWYERFRREVNMRLRQRGVYRVGPASLQSGDLFGFFQNLGTGGPAETVTVFPALLPLADLGLPADDPFGERRTLRRLFEDPNRPAGVREYHPDDGLRRVHWPATARTGALQVKVYQPVSAQVAVICLNTATFEHYWEGYLPGMLEHLLSLAGTLAYHGLQNGYPVGLVSNGCLSNSDQPFRIPPGRSQRQMAQVLTALAGVTPLVSAPFETFLLREAPRLPFGAMLVVLTALTPPSLSETLLRLKKKERRITLISIAKTAPPSLPGVTIIHLPYQEPDA